MWVMIVTWVLGFTLKFAVPSSVIKPSLVESISGCVLPVLFLGIMEVISALRGRTSPGYDAIAAYTDPNADKEPDERMKKAVKSYSHTAISCFCITLAAIALLLIALLIARDPKTMAVKGIVLGFIVSILAICGIYLIYRIIDRK